MTPAEEDRFAKLEARLDWAMGRIEVLEGQLAAANAKITQLTAQLKQDSSNSSKPPSSDPPFSKPSANSPPKTPGAKPGGQPGHKKHSRKLAVDCDFAIPSFPTRCPCGSTKFTRFEDLESVQSFELVARPFEVVEHVRFSACCVACREVVAAPFADGRPASFGPRLTAMVGLCGGKLGMSKRNTQWLLNEVLGIPLATGTICKLEQVVSESLAPVYSDIESAARKAWRANCDETGWFVKGELWWLWVMSTKDAVLFKVQDSRSTKAAQELMKDFSGLLGSDRFSSYNEYALEKRQLCWAHLLRDFAKWALQGSKGALELMWLSKVLFAGWFRQKAGAMTFEEFQGVAGQLKAGMADWLEMVANEQVPQASNSARRLQKVWEAAWRFTESAGIEPTNNEAERALRKAVLWRKRSYGTKSESGNRFTERILSFVETLGKRARSVFAELSLAVDGLRSGSPYRLTS